MKTDFIDSMRCPYCGGGLEIAQICRSENGDLYDGIIKCECGSYPVLNGIIYLKATNLRSHLIELLETKRPKDALKLAIAPGVENAYSFISFLNSAIGNNLGLKKVFQTVLNAWANRGSKKFLQDNVTFLDLLGNGSSDIYFKYRFSSDSLSSFHAFLPLLKQKGKRVLDLCCGSGHASFFTSTYVKPDELFLMDHSYKSLFLAKTYFAKNSIFVCADANYPLPFKDNFFDVVYLLDAFHYIQARSLLGKEIGRVTNSSGSFIVLHMHNSFVANFAPGMPLSPNTWERLLKTRNFHVKTFPESRLVEDFVERGILDLSKSYSENELNSSNAVAIFGSGDAVDFRLFAKANEIFIGEKGHLIVNPLYTIKQESFSIVLERTSISQREIENPLSEKYLPMKVVLSKSLSENVVSKNFVSISQESIREVELLMSKYVIINAPRIYA